MGYCIENIDIKKNIRYIVERVVTRRFLQDFYLLTKLYKEEEIQAALKKSRELDAKTVDFCSYYFNISKSECMFHHFTVKAETYQLLQFFF